jgi:hypothetical protein
MSKGRTGIRAQDITVWQSEEKTSWVLMVCHNSSYDENCTVKITAWHLARGKKLFWIPHVISTRNRIDKLWLKSTTDFAAGIIQCQECMRIAAGSVDLWINCHSKILAVRQTLAAKSTAWLRHTVASLLGPNPLTPLLMYGIPLPVS